MNTPTLLRHKARHGIAAHQRGAVLVMALAILLVMTLLGVTVMRTSSLEEKMAGNMQTSSRATNVAESCLENAYETGAPDRNTLATPGQWIVSTAIPLGAYSAKVTTKFLQVAPVPRAEGAAAYSATGSKARFYQITCKGNAGAAGVETTATRGLFVPIHSGSDS